MFRPSRKLFCDVTLYCKAAVSIELIDIISLVLKYIYVHGLILNIFLANIFVCIISLKKGIWLVWIAKNPSGDVTLLT